MALTQVTGPYPIFTDLDGTPLDDGYLYIGEINQDPEQNPIQVFFDANLTIPATQPIRTNNGYAYRNGTPALLYTAGEFSITIRNKRQEFVLYSPVGYGFDPAAVSASVVKNDFTGDGVEVDFVLSASPSTILATNVFINGVYQEKDSYTLSGNTITFSIAPPLSSSIEVMTNETGVINTGNATAITYTLTATGAVQQTVQTKLEQYVSVKDFGAVGDGVADDTAAIQDAIDNGGKHIVFPSGNYNVTTIETTVAGQTWFFDGGALLKGVASTTTKCLVLVKRGNCTFYNMSLFGNYNLNYTSLLNIQAESGFNAPQYLLFSNLILQASKIGILYGDITSPLNAPVSENHIIGGYTRDIHRIIYSNQPNGFLFVSNYTFDNQIYDWLGTATYPTYASWYTTSAAIENNEGWFSLSNCEIVKAQSDEGAVFVNADHIKVVGSICEAACTHFWGFNGTAATTSTFYVDSYTCNFFNNAVSAFIEVFVNDGYFEGTNIEYFRNVGGPALYPVGFVKTNQYDNWVFKFTNCRFGDQNIPSLFQSSYAGAAATNSLSTFSFKNCSVTNSTTGLNMPVSMSDDNLAWYYNALDIAKFNVTTSGGAAAATVANVTLANYFTKVLRLTGDTGQTCTASTKVAIDQSIRGQKRVQVLEFWQRTTSNNFNGTLELVTYDGATLLGSIELSNGAGAVANISNNPGAPVDWKKVQFVIPNAAFNVTEIQVRFTVQSVAQVWEIGNLSVY